MSEIFKILTIDGGGFRGLFSATVLSEIEKVNGSIAGHFDLLCGTSTGGLIALALAAGRSAQEVVDFYKTWGPKIFPEPTLRKRIIRKKLGDVFAPNSRNTNEVLKEAIEEIIGNKKMSEANSYLCIPAVSLIDFPPLVFKTDHAPMLTRDSSGFMRDVALATSAAPLYFPVVEVEHLPGGEFLDGGLWANNPALVSLVEAGRFFVGSKLPYKKVQIFSLASVSPAAGRASGGKRKLSVLSTGDVFTATLESQQKSTEYLIKFLIPALDFEVEYIRVPSPSISVEHCAFIGLDIANERAVKTLEYYGRKIGNEWSSRPEIKSFFEEKSLPPKFVELKESKK